jgi:hypothetical protein
VTNDDNDALYITKVLLDLGRYIHIANFIQNPGRGRTLSAICAAAELAIEKAYSTGTSG